MARWFRMRMLLRAGTSHFERRFCNRPSLRHGASCGINISRVPICRAECSGALVAALAGVGIPGLLLWWSKQRKQVIVQQGPVPLPQAMMQAGASVDDRVVLCRVGLRGLGLFVNSAVSAGTTLIRIPASTVLSGKRAREILGTELEPEVALCALLAEAMRDAKAGGDVLGLREYLLNLPADFPTLPFCFSEAEMVTELRGTALLAAVQGLKVRTESEMQAAQAALGSQLDAVSDKQLWFWARAALLTRAGPSWQVEQEDTSNSERSMVSIIPLVDFANCDADPSAECQLAESGDIRLVALRDLPANAEITLSYGAQSSEEQLFTFGMVLPGSHAVATSPVMLESERPPELRSKLLQLLAMDRSAEVGSWVMPSAQLHCQRGSSGGIDTAATVDKSELWGAVNIQEMSDEELRSLAVAVASNGRLPEELGRRAIPAARQRLRQLLDAWQSDLDATTKKRRDGRFAPARAYRAQCREMVKAALLHLEAEEQAAKLPWA